MSEQDRGIPPRSTGGSTRPGRGRHDGVGRGSDTTLGPNSSARLGSALHYGADYNPEQWPESTWPEDVRLMQQAAVTLATVGVFSWAVLEPRPGEYDFGWLDRVLDLLHDGGIAVDLATATASPPPWLAMRHPESLPVDVDGHRLWHGARQQYCPSSPAYREHALALVERLAERYRSHPALVLWHVNNEYGAHVPACYCDVSAGHFRRWLQQRYADIDALNAAWATTFWSQRYAGWAEVVPPRRTPYLPNPTQQLDFRRFSSEALLDCFRAERDVLRRLTPDVPVTTNFMQLFEPLDYRRWAAQEDVVSNNWYPDPEDPDAAARGALGFDLMRSLRGGQPWLLLEQAAGAINWRRRNRPKRPGEMRLLSYQAVARGADAVCFFQWRASLAGAEKYHSGMLPHAGPDTRVHREVRKLGAELATLSQFGGVAGAAVTADVALVLDWPSWWASELDSHPSGDFSLPDQLLAHYRPLRAAGVTVDVVGPDDDLRGYRLVVVPNLYLVEDAAAANLAAYVEGGGTLLMSFFTGIVDEHDHVRPGGYLAPFRELLGLRVEEFWPLLAGDTLSVRSELLGDFPATLWAELAHPEGAEVVARYSGGDLDGWPAILRHRYGAGTAWYVGTRPTPAAMTALLRRVCAEAGVAPVADVPADVEAVRRGELVFLLNFRAEPVRTPLPAGLERGAVDVLTGTRHDGPVALERFGVVVLLPAVRPRRADPPPGVSGG